MLPRTAREMLKTAPLTVAAATPLLEVQHLLVLAHVSGMPVIDDGGRVVGVLSASDVLRALDQALDDDHDDRELEDRFALVAKLTALDIATPDAIWVAPDTPVAQIAERMRSEGVHRVLVGNGERLDGVLTAFDMLAAVT